MMGMKRGNGNILIDVDGKVWLDMLSGILNVSLGHGNSVVQNALAEVAASGLVNTYDRPSIHALELVELLGIYDSRFTWKLLNTGAEAVERAIQVASIYYGRPVKVAVMENSFHGKSLSMACARYDVPWGNPLQIVTIDPYRCEHNFDVLLYEPVRGWDGGMVSESILAQLCNERNALLIADEMITGFGRCGQRFMNQRADMVISGKGLAQGVPMAVLGIVGGLVPEKPSIGWNTTCGGNNLSATVGLRVLQHLMLNEKGYIRAVTDIQDRLMDMEFDRVYGALGFMDLKGNLKHARSCFEDEHIIASWHDKVLRIGPSFHTLNGELKELSDAVTAMRS